MKKKTKLGLGIASMVVGVLALAGCTNSFCSTTDKAHITAAYDNGVNAYYDASNLPTGVEVYEITTINNLSNIYFAYSYANNNGGIVKANEKAKDAGIDYPRTPEYWACLDLVVLDQAVKNYNQPVSDVTTVNQILKEYGYLRFASNDESSNKVWDNWSKYDTDARILYKNLAAENKYNLTYNIDLVPSADFIKVYKNNIDTVTANFRGCITIDGGEYGAYGWDTKQEVSIEAKNYSYGWSRGFFEGLLVYPIGALIDVLCNAFQGAGNGLNGTNGWAQLFTILIVTIIVRTFMFAVSFKSTISNAKMSELQPQIAKIQAKYPNANTSQTEKARMADEMNKLYKKNHINPFSSLIVMIFQFPIFICVWGAFIGSGWLTTGQFLGVNFSDSISSVMFNAANWGNGSAWTALVLFLLMSGAQVVSMLLPQWIQKKKQKNIAKLGKNPAANQQGKTMKIVTYVMMAMIIFMGFSLASAMGVYWFVGALISVAQTLITQLIIAKHSKKGER